MHILAVMASKLWSLVQSIPLALFTAVMGATLAWLQAQRNHRRTTTFQLYQHFYSDQFSQVRNKAREFRHSWSFENNKSVQYFIYIDISFKSQAERLKYYETVTGFAGVLYFFSGLIEYLDAGLIDKGQLIKLFGHVYEWWYKAIIKEFLIAYEDEYQGAMHNVSHESRGVMNSRPPWAHNLPLLTKLLIPDSARKNI